MQMQEDFTSSVYLVSYESKVFFFVEIDWSNVYTLASISENCADNVFLIICYELRTP